MCGRFSQADPESYLDLFGAGSEQLLPPRYNVAPSLQVMVCRIGPGGARELANLTWGFVPRWAADPARLSHPINARAETLAEKPMFRDAFRQRRCLIPAEGFYEWRKEGRQRHPFFIRLKSGGPMAFAGLWDHWERPGTAPVDSCTVIVGPANAIIAPLHERMPVIIPPEAFARWLDPRTDAATLAGMLVPYPEAELEAYAVADAVNSPRNEGPALIERISW